MLQRPAYLTILALSLLSRAAWAGVNYVPSGLSPAALPREFRGVWVASVSNIDWPSTNTLDSAQQKTELIRLLDRAAKLRLNAVVLQVRPACDVLYPSKVEPWSEYLTGKMGKAPSPFYDPLAFAIAEAHKRGLELHAWFNPYRARHASAKSDLAPNHISKRRPDLVRRYGKQLWLDPGEKEVQDYSLSIVMEVVRNYDVDGVHFDDYFYPYKEVGQGGKELDFPDEGSWKRYGVRSGLSREDWRRENVNAFIQKAHSSVSAAKPWVKFGVSPFGIWRPGYPAQVKGFDAYEKLYADARKWLVNGWVDYLAPQLYWSIDSPGQSFPVLMRWWAEQNPKNRQIWPGINSYAVGRTWKPEEVVQQVKLTRKEPGVSGHIHWDIRKGLMPDNGLAMALTRDVYTELALIPVTTTSGTAGPGKPTLTAIAGKSGTRASWRPAANEPVVKWWLVQGLEQGRWTSRIVPGPQRTYAWIGRTPEAVAVTAVDRYGRLSPSSVLDKGK